nr:ATP-dependent DNA helicase PIF1-like [Tanacetum cinerariifolium]
MKAQVHVSRHLIPSVPAALSRSVPAALSRSVPAVLYRSVPAALSRSVPAALSRSVHAVLSRSVPAALSRSVHAILSRSVSTKILDRFEQTFARSVVFKNLDRLASSSRSVNFKFFNKKDHINQEIGSGSSKRKEIHDFADWILSIRNGKIGGKNDKEAIVEFLDDMLIPDSKDHIGSIIQETYSKFAENLYDPDYYKKRAILAPTYELRLFTIRTFSGNSGGGGLVVMRISVRVKVTDLGVFDWVCSERWVSVVDRWVAVAVMVVVVVIVVVVTVAGSGSSKRKEIHDFADWILSIRNGKIGGKNDKEAIVEFLDDIERWVSVVDRWVAVAVMVVVVVIVVVVTVAGKRVWV